MYLFMYVCMYDITQVTPAHDPNDYLCGKRNNLEFIIILNGDGSIAANGGMYVCMYVCVYVCMYVCIYL